MSDVAEPREGSSPVGDGLLRAKVSNQADPPPNAIKECGEAFPGKAATFEQILQWRKHAGWMSKNDPWLNGQIANPIKPPQADEKRPEGDAIDPDDEQWELSRLLDEAMRDVYKHLHDTFTDKTYDGQVLKLGRAYRSITQFHSENVGNLSKMQMASIACTRDQVAKFQNDLQLGDGKPLGVPMELLEQSFSRMNQWRADDDPMKTMKLSQYIDKDKREQHATDVAERGPPPDVKKMLKSGIEVNVTRVIHQVEMYARSNGGFTGNGLWFGVDHRMLCMNGEVSSLDKKAPFITCKTEGQWKDLLSTLDQLQIVCDSYKLPGEQALVTELTEVRHDGLKLVVQYWVLALDERKHEDARHKDPRANLLPEVLSGKGYEGKAIVQVWAQIKQMSAYEKPRDTDGMDVRKETGEPHEEHDAPARSASPNPIRSPRLGQRGKGGKGDMFANVTSDEDEFEDAVDASMVQWSNTIHMPGGVSTLRHEANKLMERAKRVADLGDHKTAWSLAAQAHSLRQQADEAEAKSSTDTSPMPATPDPKVYKPEVKYEYPSGEVRVIEAGYYTETDHLARSMEEQDLLTAVRNATAAGVEKAKLTPEQMSKYAGAGLSRSMSAAESITTAEKLAPALRDNAAIVRSVMSASREGSRHASPNASPQMGSSPPPPAPEGAITFKLPGDVLGAAERELAESLPLPKSLQPGSSLYAPSREALLQNPDLTIPDEPRMVYGAPPGAPDCADE